MTHDIVGQDTRPGPEDLMALLTLSVALHHERERITAVAHDDWNLDVDGEDGQAWQRGTLRVIWSMAIEDDERVWLHVSASRPDRLPSYLDMKGVKSVFVGDERYAYSVWADNVAHINIHPHCLHLWSPIDGHNPLPDFTRGGNSI